VTLSNLPLSATNRVHIVRTQTGRHSILKYFQNEKCIAFGPGKNMFESTKIIAENQYKKAKVMYMSKTSTARNKG